MTDTRLPLPGPLDRDPSDGVRDTAHQHLATALERIDLGAYDLQVRHWMGAYDTGIVAAVASWMRRSWDAGVAAGRRERVDETERVQRLQAEVTQMHQELEQLRAQVDELRDAGAR